MSDNLSWKFLHSEQIGKGGGDISIIKEGYTTEVKLKAKCWLLLLHLPGLSASPPPSVLGLRTNKFW